SGANESWRVADVVSRSGLPLFVSLKFNPPSSSRYVRLGEDLKKKAEKDIYPANAAELNKAGIPFALTSNGLVKGSDMLKSLQSAIKAGLPREEAVKAMTVIPARFLGIDNRVGTLEAGKIANVFLTEGELFEEKSAVRHVFADGIHFEYKAPPKKKAEESPAAVNITGKWSVQVAAPSGDMAMTAEFKQDGRQVTGSLTSDMGQWTLTGQLDGSNLTFTVTADIMGQSMELEFSGKAAPDTIEGSIAVMGESAEFKAVRIPSQGTQGRTQ
ncbi:MAG: amidohydrolase family protein, partial [Candidatus Aminicenantes bacterium]|nr:amidohydrolase family protein [Candidatus Aminicenantes bacterium]